jgi:hypothetical protein
VIQLWQQAAVRSHYTYTPVVVSLAALYVYRCHEPHKALQVLNAAAATAHNKKHTVVSTTATTTTMGTVVENDNKEKEIDEPAECRAIRKDAQAMLAGHHDMVLAPLAETEFLSALQMVAR